MGLAVRTAVVAVFGRAVKVRDYWEAVGRDEDQVYARALRQREAAQVVEAGAAIGVVGDASESDRNGAGSGVAGAAPAASVHAGAAWTDAGCCERVGVVAL